MGKSSKFLLGALLGAAAAALLTPVAGKRARAKVKQAAKQAGVPTGSLEDAVSKLVKKGGSVFSAAKDRVASADAKNKK